MVCLCLFVSGCSQKHTARIDESVDIVAGKDIVVRGYVLHIQKREGSALEGIRLVQRKPDGKETTITANTGIVTESPKQSIEVPSADTKTREKLRVALIQNGGMITLFDATMETKTQSGTNKMRAQKLEFRF